MTQNKEWSQFQDQVLKKIRDQQGVKKWSTIAQKMAEDYHIKGRNGKQCKQRYIQIFDENKQVLHWDYQTQIQMFLLHDQYGNKWAAIGQQLKNRTDNDVKNHFYSKIRKGLRKLNKIIKTKFKKQLKQIKPTVLNKIIEGAQDRFSPLPVHQQDVWNFCIESKNQLLKMSYDQEIKNNWENFNKNRQAIKDFCQNLLFFNKQFKRKPKIIKRTSDQLYQKVGSQNYSQQQYNTSNMIDSEISEDESDQSYAERQQITYNNLKESFTVHNFKQIPILPKKSEKNIILKSSTQMKEQKQNEMKIDSVQQSKTIELINSIPKLTHYSSRMDQEDMQGIGFYQKQGLHKQRNSFASRNSNFNNYLINVGGDQMEAQQDFHFFCEEQSLNQRIFTTGVGGKKGRNLEQSFKSDKLFKSIERSTKLFSLQGSQSGKMSIQMSLQRSIGQPQQRNSLFQSIGR